MSGSTTVLRLEFTAADLLRTRFAERPAPLTELCLAVALLQQPRPAPVFTPWTDRLRRGLRAPALRPLTALVPPSGRGPLFLDPAAGDLAEGIDLVRGSPAELVHADLRRVCSTERPATSWTAGLDRREPAAWKELELALRTGFRDLLARDWPRVHAAFHADVAWRRRVGAERGLGAMLSGLLPGGRWEGTALLLPSRRDSRRPVGGDGLTLLPSAFWTAEALFGRYPDGTALLIYPALTPLPLITPDPDPEAALGALLGPTRAAVLQLLADPHTTTGLARALGISPATASAHAKTLRSAGLVTTRREGKSVRHVRTSLGARLVADAPPAEGLSREHRGRGRACPPR